MKRMFVVLAALFTMYSCMDNQSSKKQNALVQNDTAQRKLPTDIQQLVDTLNRGKLSITDTLLAMHWVDSLMLKHTAAKDSFSFYSLIQQKARNYFERDNSDSFAAYYEKGLAFFERQPYFTKWPLIDHYRLAILHGEQNDFQTAIMHATKARLEAENPAIKEHMSVKILVIYLSDLGALCKAGSYYDDAHTNINAGINLAGTLDEKDKFLITVLYTEKGSIFLEEGKTDSAAKYVKLAQAYYNQYPNDKAAERLDIVMGSYYTAAEQLDSAIFYLKKTLERDATQGKVPPLISIKNLSRSYLDKGLFQQAAHYVSECRSLIARYPGAYTVRDSNSLYTYLLEYNIACNTDKKTAYADYLAYQETNFRYINDQQIRAVKDMEGRYQLNKKQIDIERLNSNVLEKKLELKQKNQFIGIGLAACAALLLTGLWAYSLQRQKRLQLQKDGLQQEVTKVQLEQRLLRTQMEPHFIFNSLAVLQSFIREKNEQKSISYLSTFAKLLRQSLEHSRQSVVPLHKEIDALKNYLALQQMRFEGLFVYHIECPAEMMADDDLRLPPMLLQPFVENCIQHGFQGIDYLGKITITVVAGESFLNIRICDNGVGNKIKKEAIGNHQHQSLSTRITRERLGMLSADTGVQSNLQIQPNNPHGITVEIVVPVR